jgi:membrane fusion protein, copper/silver efflux system
MYTKFFHNAYAVTKVALARLRFLAVFVVAALVVGYWDTIQNYWDKWTRPPVAPDALAHVSDIEYYCVMHPNVIRHEPGNCPICGMPLAKRKKGEHSTLPTDILARVQLTPYRIALAGIQTSVVEERPLVRDIRAAATLDYDETRVAQLSARVAGRADELFVKSLGHPVKAGDPLYSIYSPDVYTAQREYLLARKRVKDLPQNVSDDIRQDAVMVYNATMQKLILWGATNADLNRLDQQFDATGQVATHFVVSSPMAGLVVKKSLFEGGYVQTGDVPYTIADLGNLWLQVRLYEQDVPLIKLGQEVKITVAGMARDAFAGKITYLAYQLDPITRTLAARVEVANPDLQLRPGVFADALIRVPLAEEAATQPATVAATTAPAAGNAAIFRDALDPYLTAHQLLAQDKTDGVSLALHQMLDKLAKIQGPADLLAHREKITPLVHGTMTAGTDIEKLRNAFRDISAELIAIGQITGTPAGDVVRVFRCPMEPQPNWLQLARDTINPYQGTKMLDCGAQISTLPQAGVPVASRISPGGPTLAVPRSAVIITGARKVVFAANPQMDGVFDMKPVQLGRLGTSPDGAEYYPVLQGLSPGDKVVTVGAFLLDAENRLAGTPPAPAAEPAAKPLTTDH